MLFSLLSVWVSISSETREEIKLWLFVFLPCIYVASSHYGFLPTICDQFVFNCERNNKKWLAWTSTFNGIYCDEFLRLPFFDPCWRQPSYIFLEFSYFAGPSGWSPLWKPKWKCWGYFMPNITFYSRSSYHPYQLKNMFSFLREKASGRYFPSQTKHSKSCQVFVRYVRSWADRKYYIC